MGLQSLFSAHPMIMLYICSKFYENISKAFRVIELTWFPELNFQRGFILSKLLVELHFLICGHCLMMLYFCTKFHENISKDSELLSGHDFRTKIFKGA